jgi:hypothetical protein
MSGDVTHAGFATCSCAQDSRRDAAKPRWYEHNLTRPISPLLELAPQAVAGQDPMQPPAPANTAKQIGQPLARWSRRVGRHGEPSAMCVRTVVQSMPSLAGDDFPSLQREL